MVRIVLPEKTASSGSAPNDDDLDFFRTTAFSMTKFSSDIEMLNPEALRIERDEANNVIMARSEGGFSFANEALGYRVTVHDFHLGGNQVGMTWNGYVLYEPMTAEKSKDEKRWRKNRETVYEGSRRHFLSALMNDQVKKQEWAAWFVMGPGAMEDHSPIQEAGLKGIYGEPQPVRFDDPRPNTQRLDWAGWLRIEYYGQGGDARWGEYIERYWPVSDLSEVLASQPNVTYVELPEFQAFVDHTGVLTPSMAPQTTELGFWTFYRMADMLPNDWMPED